MTKVLLKIAPVSENPSNTGLPGGLKSAKLMTSQPHDVEREVEEVVANAQEWLDTPNDRFEGRPPRALIHTDEERRLCELIEFIKHGINRSTCFPQYIKTALSPLRFSLSSLRLSDEFCHPTPDSGYACCTAG